MKKWLSFICCLLVVLGLKGQDTASTRLSFASLYGTTGVFQTPNTHTVGRFRGNIGVFENLRADSLDQVVFCFGVHPNIEVGLQSDIPTQPDPRLNFFFKIKGFQQGRFLRWQSRFFPATAFGLQQNGAFAVAGYSIRAFHLAGGYNFSDHRQGLFGNVSYQPFRYAALQAEYQHDGLGFGLRTHYRGLELSMLYRHDLPDDTFREQQAYWRIAYNFSAAGP